MFSSKEIVETVRKRYPVGCCVRLVKMDDVQTPPIGTLGTVYDVDDTGLTGADITHENEERYRFSFDFDENCPADNSEPRVHATYDFWKGDDEESVEWAVFEVTTDKPFFLLSYEEYESIVLTGFYDSFDEAFEEMKELIAESVNDVFDEDATADDVEDMEDYNVFVHSNKDSKDSGAPLAFASFCDDYPNREWTIFHI